MSFLSKPVDTSHLPEFPSKLPVRLHADYETTQQFTLETVNAVKKEGTKAYKHAYYRHAVIEPEMNFYALGWCEADFERLKFVIEFLELLWNHDDVVEEISVSGAHDLTEQLRRAMYAEYDSDPTTDSEFGIRVRKFRDIRNRMSKIDVEGTLEVIESTEEWFPIDKKLKEWTSIEEYLEFRKAHVGNGMMTTLVRWSMNIHLTKEELEFIQPFVDEIGEWLGMYNDFFSWKKERMQKTDRVVNIVHLLMKMHNIGEEAAIDLVRELLVKKEATVLEMYKELRKKTGLSTGMKMYIEGLILYAGGTFYYTILAPRYRNPINVE